MKKTKIRELEQWEVTNRSLLTQQQAPKHFIGGAPLTKEEIAEKEKYHQHLLDTFPMYDNHINW